MKHWVVCAVLLMAGCDLLRHPVDSLFDDYINRIANVQDEAALQLPPNESTVLPDKRDLSLEIRPITIGLLDSYELRKCGLFNLIAERNSVLGKIQDQFREFDFQVALNRGLKRCIASNDLSTKLKEQLESIHYRKRAQLPIYSANLIFTSNAMREQLSSHQWVAIENQITSSELLHAYNQLLSLLSSEQKSNQRSLTLHQEVFEKNNLMGQLWFSLHNANKKLAQINQQLKQYDHKIICQAGRDKTKFRYLNNVFNHVYIEQLQPYLARLDAHYFRLLPYVEILETSHPNYQYPIRSVHQSFRAQNLAHVEYWKTLFSRCGKKVAR